MPTGRRAGWRACGRREGGLVLGRALLHWLQTPPAEPSLFLPPAGQAAAGAPALAPLLQRQVLRGGGRRGVSRRRGIKMARPGGALMSCAHRGVLHTALFSHPLPALLGKGNECTGSLIRRRAASQLRAVRAVAGSAADEKNLLPPHRGCELRFPIVHCEQKRPTPCACQTLPPPLVGLWKRSWQHKDIAYRPAPPIRL